MNTGSTAHSPLDTSTADRLLELLSSDDDYRALFAHDRQAALKQIGYTDASHPSVQCTSVDRLASKDEIAAARDELRAYLTSEAALTVIFCFEANRISSTMRER